MKENITLKVKGMFCSNCELKIEKNLSKCDGILDVKASFNNEEVNITFDKDIMKQKEIEKLINDLDYEVVHKKKINVESIYILIIILAIYIILEHLGFLKIFNIFPTVENTMDYGMIFIVGILTSVHCIAMCGGINLSQSVSSVKNNVKVLKTNFNYNLGRIISYTLIGGIVGTIGSIISFNGIFKGIVAIIAAIFMIIIAINMLGIFPKLRKFNIRIPKKLAIFLNNTKKGKGSFYIGLINGLMPCGPLQTMQLYALSKASFLGGAISMFLFSLGTVPLMFTFGVISSKLNKKFTEKMLTVSAIIIFILGISMLNTGLSLSGLKINIETNTSENIAEVIDDYQQIETIIDYGSYEPITVKKGIPVKWVINVPEEKLNGCNNEIFIPKYNIDVKLEVGENIIEFFPDETGIINYSCWMGMINSTITVIE